MSIPVIPYLAVKSFTRQASGGKQRTFTRRHPVLLSQELLKEETTQSAVFSHLESGAAEFGAWVDEGSRNNGFNSGGVIECPPYVIEYILREILGMTTAEIDYESFDISGNTTNGTIKTWKFFGAISDIESSKDVLQRLCLQCKSKLFRDADGMFSFWTYNISAALTYTDYKFSKDNNIANLSISRSPRNDIANTIRINYMLDRGSGKFQRQTFIEVNKKYSGSLTAEAIDSTEYEWTVDDGTDFTADDYILTDHELNRVESIAGNVLTLYNSGGIRTTYQSSIAVAHNDNTSIYILTTNSDDGTGVRDQNSANPDDRELEAMESVWRYGITLPYELDCDFVIDDATAQALREHYFDYLRAPKYIIEFDTFLNASDLIVNDIFEFDDAVMDTYMKLGGATWASQKFVCLNIERNSNLNYHVIGEHLTYSFI